MNARGKDGLPRSAHLERAATGICPDPKAQAELEHWATTKVPFLMADVWDHYLRLDMRRDWNENGPKRFSWLDIDAYVSTNEVRLGRWHLKTIFALEDAWFAHRAENKE